MIRLENYLANKSPREKTLFALLIFVLMCYLTNLTEQVENILSLRSTFQSYAKQPQTQFLQEQELNTKLQNLTATLQSQIPSSSMLLKTISQSLSSHSLTLTHSSIQKLQDSYTLHIKSQGEFENFIKLLNSILATPTLSIQSLLINHLSIDLLLTPTPIAPPKFDISIDPQTLLQTIENKLSSPKKLSLSNPFSTHTPKLILEAILNKKARINGIWISQGEKIFDYTLQKISTDFVVLQKLEEKQTLHLKSKRIFQ